MLNQSLDANICHPCSSHRLFLNKGTDHPVKNIPDGFKAMVWPMHTQGSEVLIRFIGLGNLAVSLTVRPGSYQDHINHHIAMIQKDIGECDFQVRIVLATAKIRDLAL